MQKLFSIVTLLLVLFFGLEATSAQVQKRMVAVTVDDLPSNAGEYPVMKQINDRLLAALKAHRVPAIGFVVGSRLEAAGQTALRTNILRQWLNDGHDLGNHSFSHVAIDRVAFPAYAADVVRGEQVLTTLLTEKGRKLKYYRHTQLRTGPTEEYRRQLSEFLAGRGYTVAPVTVDNNDYVYSIAYSRVKAKGDKKLAKKVADDYLRYMESVFEHFERLSTEFLGYEVRQTLLIHANEINADHFGGLAERLTKRGYEFVTLDEALKDHAYAMPEAQSKKGISWLHRWMLAKGLTIKEEPSQPEWITKLAQY